MTSKKRLNILMADDSSQHARAAVKFLRDIPLLPRCRIMVLRVFTPDQIPGIPEFEKRTFSRESEKCSVTPDNNLHG